MSAFTFPHVRYINKPNGYSGNLYYIGYSTDRLTKGKEYELREALYSPDEDRERLVVYIVNDNQNKIIQVDINQFVTLSELRELKIKEILK